MRSRRRQQGQAIVLLALMMAVLVGFVALAIDSARAFDSRRILQDSVDAAALAAADSYQAGSGWGTAEANAMTVFEQDNRLYGGDNCPAGGFAAPTTVTPVTTVCTPSGSGYTVQITAANIAAAGQSFVIVANRQLPVALMQVLSGTTTISVQATGGAVANDQSQTPALGGLATDDTCPGGAGPTPSIHIENKTDYLTVLGDVVSNGSLNIGGLSYVHLAGNALTRCAAPINGDHITYECWQRGETPSPGCAADELTGTLYSTRNRLADPGYLPPPTPSGFPGLPGAPVVLAPGMYNLDPNFGNNGPCYFLAAGVYDWLGGLTVNSGQISNELKPPHESGTQFWQHSNCAGDFALTAKPNGVREALPAGSYSAVVTSARTDVVNGVSYTRESAPSACRSITVGSGQVVQVVISNVPGAQSYNLYAATNNTCTPPFGLTSLPILNPVLEKNSPVSGCPDTAMPAGGNCALGQVVAFYDGDTTSNNAKNPPAAETAQFGVGLPGQNAARAAPPAGDLANENLCATVLAVKTTCPANMANGASAKYVTPGAVAMLVTQNSCINVAGGDAFLFSGYQYNWIVNYEPAATTCTNSWNGVNNSDAIGLSYTPSAAFTINGDSSCAGGVCNTTGSFEGPIGGIVAGTIHINYSSGLVIDFDPHYAPAPPGSRLTV